MMIKLDHGGSFKLILIPKGEGAYLIEVVPDDLPDAGPLQPDPPHVVVGDLYDLLEAEHAGVRQTGEFIHRHGT